MHNVIVSFAEDRAGDSKGLTLAYNLFVTYLFVCLVFSPRHISLEGTSCKLLKEKMKDEKRMRVHHRNVPEAITQE